MALKHSHRNEINSREEICVIKWNSYNDAQKFSTREGENDAYNWNQSQEKPRHDRPRPGDSRATTAIYSRLRKFVRLLIVIFIGFN